MCLILMVNNQLKFQRQGRIQEILKILKIARDKKRTIDQKEFIMQICVKYDVQQRKASEYLKVAQYMLDHQKEVK